MKKAPNWHTKADSVDGVWKQDLLRFLGKYFNLKVLVETGTCEASTIISVCNDFTDIYSIELAEYYYKIAARRTADIRNIHLFQGNSAKLLPGVLRKLTMPTLFWLDAHSSGGKTANVADVLPSEIATITSLAPNGLVVIDDCQSDELAQVTAAGISLDGWERYYISGEVIMHRGSYGDITKLFEE